MTATPTNTQERRCFTDGLLEKLRNDNDDADFRRAIDGLSAGAQLALRREEWGMALTLCLGSYCVAIVADLLVEQAEAKGETP